MSYYVKQQTINGVTTEFDLNNISEFDIYADKNDLLNDIIDFNSGYSKLSNLHYKNEKLEILLGEILDKDEIQALLLEIGDTGGYRLNSKRELYIQKEENSYWQYAGQVLSHSEVHNIWDTIKGE